MVPEDQPRLNWVSIPEFMGAEQCAMLTILNIGGFGDTNIVTFDLSHCPVTGQRKRQWYL